MQVTGAAHLRTGVHVLHVDGRAMPELKNDPGVHCVQNESVELLQVRALSQPLTAVQFWQVPFCENCPAPHATGTH